jgi:DNA-binding XRE family transcriptional regulator
LIRPASRRKGKIRGISYGDDFRFRQIHCPVAAILQHRRVLGENIRSKRKSIGYSQERLAEKAELHPTYVSDVERGQETISVDALARIAKALKTPLRDFFDGL